MVSMELKSVNLPMISLSRGEIMFMLGRELKTEFYRLVLLLPFLRQRMMMLDIVHRGLDWG